MRFRGRDDRLELGTRNIKLALRRLRKLATTMTIITKAAIPNAGQT